jgi:hypothetical protein
MGIGVLLAAAVMALPRPSPRLALSATTARPGDQLVVRVSNPPRAKPLQIALVASDFAAERLVRSDPRVHRIATFAPRRGRTANFAVPSLATGTYLLAYSTTRIVRLVRSPVLQVETPPEPAACPVTRPNGIAPPGAPPLSFYGNSALAVLVPADGVMHSAKPDGTLFAKMLWIAAGYSHLRVSYRRLDVAAPAIGAVTVGGTLSGYDKGPSWASRMYFDRGCWEVRGTVASGALTVVLRVLAS